MSTDPTTDTEPNAGRDEGARHTPGPWTIWNSDSSEWTIRARGKVIAGVVASVRVDWRLADQQAEQKSNARLIAAAPELLEALAMLHDETADYITINKLGPVHHNRSMQLARDALAKARASVTLQAQGEPR